MNFQHLFHSPEEKFIISLYMAFQDLENLSPSYNFDQGTRDTIELYSEKMNYSSFKNALAFILGCIIATDSKNLDKICKNSLKKHTKILKSFTDITTLDVLRYARFAHINKLYIP